ncbi:aminopeptidase N-like protein [Tribolium castaneum]|uniref:Aminopeptidase n=1 Tax=Tribolium castaneum TaxID=7070 RepID=D6WB39_TRICA|nr:PREDICTED: aminopeptidase N isoform X1 [Tribolium castaneum]EEZ99339.1 aminopeptidase N-like protein [Tribolium castaneum]|eukprot:XP_008200834.1 PREDICTED: aminopeptidase N isoform X1 [Tribolium castaneum]
MVGRTEYSSVPTAVDLENNTNQKKYTVNREPGGLVIPKSLCALMAIGALLLAILVGLLVFFFVVPRCSQASDTRPSDLRVGDDGLPSISDEISLTKIDSPSLELDERLPRSLEPTHYRIQVRPFFSNLTFDGTVTITMHVKEQTDQIIFNVKDIEIDKQSVKVRSVKSNTPLGISRQDYVPGERYKIVLDSSLDKNIMYTLELTYVGHLNNHLQGFYRSQYDENNSVKYLASTQFSPTDARRAFPCFDEPSFKANFSLIVGRPSNMSSLANMPLIKSDSDWDYYETTPKMSPYLVAFVVSNLQAYGSSDKLIKVWTRETLRIQARYAAEFAPKVLHYFENYFNIAFPLPKIDIVAIPDFGYNAMENWGLITFRESSLLYNTDEPDVDTKRTIATILSHELGHQWFGNLVTPKWWNDLWLKEGFATYLQYLGADFAEPSWNIKEEFIFSETARAFALDALQSSRPISYEVKNSRQIRQTFDELSYAKGASVVRMMNNFLGEDAFKTGLINYLRKYEYSNGDRDDLFGALTEVAHRKGALEPSVTVKDVMDSWTKQPGFPVITAIRDPANKKLILSQKRFLFTDNHNDSSTWWVPVSVTTNGGNFETQPTVWLKNEPMVTINLNTSLWYLININQTGYYIVNYDEANWRSLTRHLMSLPTIIRAQLISDSMDLARANLLDYDIPLKLVQHMALRDKFIMFVPTNVAFKKLEFLSDMLSATPAFGLFESFVSTIFRDTYRTVNSDLDYGSENYLHQKIRKMVLKWACRKTDSECAITSHRMFRDWMEYARTIPPNIRDVVYCTAIRQGSEAEWRFAFNRYLNTSSVSEKNVLLDALGCTTQKWLLSRYLDNLVRNHSSIRIQDADRVFKSVCDNNIASTLAFDFLRTNWDKLISFYGEGFNIISKMVKSLPRFMNTEYQLSELVRFRNQVRHNLGTASQAFDSAIERVRGNVAWMKKNYHNVEKWLIDNKEHFHA